MYDPVMDKDWFKDLIDSLDGLLTWSELSQEQRQAITDAANALEKFIHMEVKP